MRQNRMGLSILDLLVVIVMVVGAIVVIYFVSREWGKSRCGAAQMADAMSTRDILRGFVSFSASNQDHYPLPSLLDAADETLAGPAAAKDTTSSILSFMIYNGYITPERCVSKAENNPSIKIMKTYSRSAPPTARVPSKALWDPAFNADFTSGVGNTSYAHMPPSGERLKDWVRNYSADTPVIGNRGPQVKKVVLSQNGVGKATFAPSLTLSRCDSDGKNWRGYVAFSDEHVSSLRSTFQDFTFYLDASGKPRPDCLFFDEPEDVQRRNAFLSIWRTAGATPSEFAPIWD